MKKVILTLGLLGAIYGSSFGDILTPKAQDLLDTLQTLQQLGDTRGRLEGEELIQTEEYKIVKDQIYNEVDKLENLINEMADKPAAETIIKEEIAEKIKQVQEKGTEYYEKAKETIGSWFGR